MRLLGILLVIAGVVLLIYGGLTFIIPRDVWELGAFTIAVNNNIVIPLPPVVGIISLILGFLCIMAAPRRYYY
jgi:hypothetical protein